MHRQGTLHADEFQGLYGKRNQNDLMHAILQNVESQYQSILDPMDAEETQRHPDGNPLRWNIQQVVEHLILTYQLSSATLSRRLEKRRPTAARCTPLEWGLQLVILSLGRMPKGVPASSDTVPRPAPPSSGHELARKLIEEAENMDDLLNQCRARFGLQRVASHSVLGPLRVDQWRRFHAIHGLHHLAQIKRILKAAPAHRLVRPAISEKTRIPSDRTPA